MSQADELLTLVLKNWENKLSGNMVNVIDDIKTYLNEKPHEPQPDSVHFSVEHHSRLVYDKVTRSIVKESAAPPSEVAALIERLREIDVSLTKHTPVTFKRISDDPSIFAEAADALARLSAPVPGREWIPTEAKTPDDMLARDCLYAVGDTKAPNSLVPIVVRNGDAYAVKLEPIPLCKWGWLETVTIYGGFVRPMSALGKLSGMQEAATKAMTIDDAAERRITELTSFAWGGARANDAIRTAWAEATEAAAKKCDAIAESYDYDGNQHYASLRCAAAIRGVNG